MNTRRASSIGRYLTMAFLAWSAWCMAMHLMPDVFAGPYTRAAARILVLAVPTCLWAREARRAGQLEPLYSTANLRSGLVWGLGAAIVFLGPGVAYEISGGASFVLPTSGAVWMNYVVGSPIAEEAFFRGLVFQSYRERRGPLLAAVYSSAFFALFHVPAWWLDGEPWIPAVKLTTIFLYGLIFSGLYQFSRSLYGSTVPHILNNLVGLSLR